MPEVNLQVFLEYPYVKEIVAFLAATAYASLKTLQRYTSSKQKRRFEFISDFFKQDISSREKIEVEHAFWHYLGKRFDYAVIERILNTESPLTNFFLFSTGQPCLQVNTDEEVTFSLKSRYQKKWKKKCLQAWFFIIYFFFAMLTATLLMNSAQVISSGGMYEIPKIAILCLSLGSLAYFGLESFLRIQSAEEFISKISKDSITKCSSTVPAEKQPPLGPLRVPFSTAFCNLRKNRI